MDFSTIFRDALYVFLAAVAGIITKFLVSLFNQGITYLKEKIDNIKNEKFKDYCKEMMEAAETMTDTLLNGSMKKDWVTQKLIEYTKKKNINITESEISILIQAIFKELDGITLNTYKQANNSNSNPNVNVDEIINKTINAMLLAATEPSGPAQ